ncbi:MAG TPA: phosphate signaling complex protein PhoU [Thermomicrobiales bacterium]|nr:phosphate signaling complex protein PhoU [Thermomicrobiales bacterium]
MNETKRALYEAGIEDLRNDVVTMSSMVDKAIARAIDALKTQDAQLAAEVKAGDKEIDALRWDAEDAAMTLIATQGPMAGDLRVIAASLQIFTDLERMGDYAVGVAKVVLKTIDEPLLKPLVDIPRMAQLAREMLSDVTTAFIESDAEAAKEIAARDDEIDDLYDQVLRELLTYMMSDPSVINRATHLLWAAHDVERIGDRVTNIAERITYMTSGEFVHLGGGRKKRQRARDAASLEAASASNASGLA